jgi:hypothetical protein
MAVVVVAVVVVVVVVAVATVVVKFTKSLIQSCEVYEKKF